MATSWRNKKNYPLGQGTLNTAIDDNDLTIVLDAGQGASFPSASFTISIDEEIILIDSRSTDTLTVNASGRGYDNSTASAHAAGVAIANNQIVKDFTDCETAINGIENGTTTLAKVVVDGSAASSMKLSDAGTNTVVSVLELYHMSSGTPASGLGAKMILGAKDSAGNAEAAIEIQGYLSTVTSGAEVGAYLLRIVNGGSLATALTITPTAATFASPITSASDTDATFIFGRARIDSRASDLAYFSHIDHTAAGSFAISMNASGDTFVNCTSGRTVFFRQGGNNRFNLTGSTITINDTVNLLFETTTGSKIGTGATQKIGFWNATPIVQPASANQAALTNSTAGTYDGTLAALPDPADTPASADALRDDIVTNLIPVLRNNFTDIHTLLDAIRTALVNSGLMKGAA